VKKPLHLHTPHFTTLLFIIKYTDFIDFQNLGSYVVALGILPLRTATQLFGIGAANQTRVPIANRPDRGGRTGPGSRHTNIRLVEHASISAGDAQSMTQEGGRYAWITHNKGQNKASSVASSSSSADTGRLSGSLPASPRRRSKTSLPPTEASTDTEQSSRPSRRRQEYRASTGTIKDEVATSVLLTDDEVVDSRRTRNRSKVDHSTRRILFVDAKVSRRQTAPLASITNTPEGSSTPARPAQPVSAVVLTDSPKPGSVTLSHDSVGPSSLNNSATPESRPKSEHDTSAEPSRPTSVSQFGEFVSASSTSTSGDAVERGRTLGSESATESKKDKGTKEKQKGSGFKLFGRKRSNSISGQTTVPEASSSVAAACAQRLRRKSPYPAKAEDKNARRGEGSAVTMSDAEVSSSYPTSTSMSWLRTRPKRLTKKGRSSSVSSDARVPSTSSTNANTTSTEQSRPSQSSSWLPLKTPTSSRKIPTTPDSTPPVLTRSSTSATQNSICATSNTHGHSRSRFNPIRDLEAHLYNKHGVGTGPGTADPFEYRITPVPKEGIKRTNPYELLGIDRRSTSSANTPTENVGKREKLDEDKKLPNPRRTSAPAGSLSLTQSTSSRPHTPSRSHTQPL
jgi:hypothetical protein